MHPYIQIGKMVFESYTLFNNLGAVVGIATAYFFLAHKKWRELDIVKVLLSIILCIFIGAPVARLLKNAFEVEKFGEATHFLGRVLVFAIAIPIAYRYIFKDKIAKVQAYNATALYVIIQHFFNRTACYLNGCCGAGEGSILPFPRQLFEAFMMLCILAVLIIIIKKKNNGLFISFILYGIVIFISEFFADETRIFRLTSVQYGAVLLVVLSLAYMIYDFKTEKKDEITEKKIAENDTKQ